MDLKTETPVLNDQDKQIKKVDDLNTGQDKKPEKAKSKKVKVSKKALRQAEQELQMFLVEKKKAEQELQRLEASIYEQETNYLKSTMLEGNVLRGFNGLIGSVPRSERKKENISEYRIFSGSSVSLSSRSKYVNNEDMLALSLGSGTKGHSGLSSNPNSNSKFNSNLGVGSGSGSTSRAANSPNSHLHKDSWGLPSESGDGGNSSDVAVSKKSHTSSSVKNKKISLLTGQPTTSTKTKKLKLSIE